MRIHTILSLALLAITLTWEVTAAFRLNAVIMKCGEMIYVQAVARLRSHSPRNAIVVTRLASGSFLYYSDLAIVRYDLAGDANLQKFYSAAGKANRPVYAVIADPDPRVAFESI